MSSYTELKNPVIEIYLRFCNVLDGSKTGLRVKRDVLKVDMSHPKLFGRPPDWRESANSKGQDKTRQDNLSTIKRPQHHKKFIMDIILSEGKKAMDKHLGEYSDKVKGTEEAEDTTLAEQWHEAVQYAEEKGGEAALRDLEKIQQHVQAMRQKHRTDVASMSPRKSSTNSPNKKISSNSSFTDMKIEDRQDILRAISREFAEGPRDLEFFDERVNHLSLIKASYAYVYDREVAPKKWTRFPWDVAMGALGEIKAKAKGLSMTVMMEMYENKTTNSSIKPSKLYKST